MIVMEKFAGRPLLTHLFPFNDRTGNTHCCAFISDGDKIPIKATGGGQLAHMWTASPQMN